MDESYDERQYMNIRDDLMSVLYKELCGNSIYTAGAIAQ